MSQEKAAETSTQAKKPRAKTASLKQNQKTLYKKQTALEILRKDHKEVLQAFKKFEKLSKKQVDTSEKYRLVRTICDMLTMHTRLEEAIFYPALRDALDEDQILNEAKVEHNCAKELIEKLRTMGIEHPLYDATCIVLGEQVKHHIEEEENELFPKAQKSSLDLENLGKRMKAFKEEMEKDRRRHYGEEEENDAASVASFSRQRFQIPASSF